MMNEGVKFGIMICVLFFFVIVAGAVNQALNFIVHAVPTVSRCILLALDHMLATI